MSKLFVVGIGPGGAEYMSAQAAEALKQSEIIVGYSGYIEYIKPFIEGKEVFQTGMTGEIERCKYAVSKVKEGKTVSIISTGDAGLYGMAGPILELAPDLNVEIIPGISAAFAAASRLGAPLMHDTALISLSDRLTDYAVIKKKSRLSGGGRLCNCSLQSKIQNPFRLYRRSRKYNLKIQGSPNTCRHSKKCMP